MTVADLRFRALSRRRILGIAYAAGGVAFLRPLRTRADATGPVLSMLDIRRKNTVVQEWDLSCGAAALATILRYQHGDNVGERYGVHASFADSRLVSWTAAQSKRNRNPD
jgi:predicted double-glycine peptidase